MSSLLPYLAFALVLCGFVLAYRWRGGGNRYYANRGMSGPIGGNFTPGSPHVSSGHGGGWDSGGGSCGDGGGGSCG